MIWNRQLAEEADPDKFTELIHKQSAMLDLSNSLASALSWKQQMLLWKAMHNLILDGNPEIQKRAYAVASCILKRLGEGKALDEESGVGNSEKRLWSVSLGRRSHLSQSLNFSISPWSPGRNAGSGMPTTMGDTTSKTRISWQS